MIRLATYAALDLAGIGCLIGTLMLSAGTHEATFIGAAGGAGIAILGMAAMLIQEEVRGGYREKAVCLVAAAVSTQS
jgi:hypothetical protein